MGAVNRDVLDFAVALADRAGRLAVERFYAADFDIATKRDGTEVTDADLAVENLIRAELGRRFPDDEVHGEEAGTTYFAHRIPLFGINLAYEDERGPAIGVINEPIARRVVFAGRGLGCRIRTGGTDAAPRLRDTADLAHARVEMVNPHRWTGELIATLHRNVLVTGHLGGVAGVLTGLLDAIASAGSKWSSRISRPCR